MNFKKLQAMQLELDNSILSAKPQMPVEERLNKTLVALSVEVAEVANCAEHFKFWKDGKGKVDNNRFLDTYDSSGRKDGLLYDKNNKEMGLTWKQAHHLTLLEECSDCLHFILSLANQLGNQLSDLDIMDIGNRSEEHSYLVIQLNVTSLFYKDSANNKKAIFNAMVIRFMKYMDTLGITTDELEQAYYEKNEENCRRLREGY